MPKNPPGPPEPFSKLRTLADSSSSLDGSRLSWVEGVADARDAPLLPACEVVDITISRWRRC